MDRNPFWLGSDPLVLASRSSGRRKMLEAAGIPLVCSPADVDEREIEHALEEGVRRKPAELAIALAHAKALEVSRRYPRRFVLGCDQILSMDGRIMHKAGDLEGAVRQLATMAGREHSLHSAAVLVADGAVLAKSVEVASLTMRNFSSHFLRAYARAQGDVLLGTVGGYEIEGMGLHLFEQVRGDQATIVGLPLLPVLKMLRTAGLMLG